MKSGTFYLSRDCTFPLNIIIIMPVQFYSINHSVGQAFILYIMYDMSAPNNTNKDFDF